MQMVYHGQTGPFLENGKAKLNLAFKNAQFGIQKIAIWPIIKKSVKTLKALLKALD